MLFDISDLDPRGADVEGTVEIPPFSWEGDETVHCRPAPLVGRLTPTRRGIELVARFETVARVRCVRCLAEFDKPLEGRFRLFLIPGLGEESEGTEPVFDNIPDDDPDAIDLYPLEGKVVDLAEVLREQVDLALPTRLLCRETCRGLCAGCGVDLNKETCRCASEGDERLGSLAQFKELLERKKHQEPPKGR